MFSLQIVIYNYEAVKRNDIFLLFDKSPYLGIMQELLLLLHGRVLQIITGPRHHPHLVLATSTFLYATVYYNDIKHPDYLYYTRYYY